MIFDWANYLTLAEYLNSNNTSEASQRSSISRSYYSVYHKARFFCLYKLKIINQKESVGSNCHQLILQRLIDENDQDLFEIAKRIEALKIRRKKADYISDTEITPLLVTDTIEKSKDVIAMMADFEP